MSSDISDSSGSDMSMHYITDDPNDDNLFSTLLRLKFENRIHMDVVKAKRDNIMHQLHVVELALEKKDYVASCLFLSDVCKTIDEDEYPDEYQLQPVESDMLLFSTCVACALAKFYTKGEITLRTLLNKSQNPVFYCVLAFICLYQLNLKEAQMYMEKAVTLLNFYEQEQIFWPWSNILITNIGAKELKMKCLLYVHIIAVIENVKCNTKTLIFGQEEILAKLDHSLNQYKGVKINSKKHIGQFLKQDIYSLVRTCVDNFIALDLGKMPPEYKNGAMLVKSVIDEYFGLQSGEESEKKTVKKMKHKVTQRNTKTHNVQVQAGFKLICRSSQTVENNENGNENLQQMLKQTHTKLKTVESNIANLKAKKSELEEKLQATDDFFMKQRTKWMCQDEQNILKVTKLEALTEILKEKLENIELQLLECNGKLSACVELLSKSYRSSYSIQREMYKHFDRKSKEILNLLVKIQKDFDPDSVPPVKEAKTYIDKWDAFFLYCSGMLEELEDYYDKIHIAIAESRFFDLLNIPDVPSLPVEPPSLHADYFASLVISLGQCQRKLQNTHIVSEEKFTQTLTEYEVADHFPIVAQTNTRLSTAEVNNTAENKTTIASLADTVALGTKLGHSELNKSTNPPQSVLYSKNSSCTELFQKMQLSDVHIPSRSKIETTYKQAETDSIESRNLLGGSFGKSFKQNPCKRDNLFNGGSSNIISSINEAGSNYELGRSNVKQYMTDFDKCTGGKSMSPANRVTSMAESHDAKYSKLHNYVKNKLSSYTDPDILRALNIFREQNNGKLSGLTFQFILTNVRKILGAPKSTWDEIKPNCKDWQSDNDDTICSICYSLFDELPVTVLKCKHKFHIECIRRWLTTNSICAICRIHVTLDEDFPPLKP